MYTTSFFKKGTSHPVSVVAMVFSLMEARLGSESVTYEAEGRD